MKVKLYAILSCEHLENNPTWPMTVFQFNINPSTATLYLDKLYPLPDWSLNFMGISQLNSHKALSWSSDFSFTNVVNVFAHHYVRPVIILKKLTWRHSVCHYTYPVSIAHSVLNTELAQYYIFYFNIKIILVFIKTFTEASNLIFSSNNQRFIFTGKRKRFL